MVDDRCCCGSIHVRTGAYVVGIIEFMFCIVAIVGGAAVLLNNWNGISGNHEYFKYAGIVALAITIVWFLSIILLLIGLIISNAVLLLPHIIITAIYLILETACIVLLIVNEGFGHVYFIIFLIIIIYLWFVVYCCYKWLKLTTG